MVIKDCSNEGLLKIIQLMSRLGITISFRSARDAMLEINITAIHLYEVLTGSDTWSICDLVDRELPMKSTVESYEKCLFFGADGLKFQKAAKFLTELDVPYESMIHYPGGTIDQGIVSAYDLYDIFCDREKLRVFATKLRALREK